MGRAAVALVARLAIGAVVVRGTQATETARVAITHAVEAEKGVAVSTVQPLNYQATATRGSGHG